MPRRKKIDIGTQHDDEKARQNPEDGKIPLGHTGTSMPHSTGGTKKHRKGQRLDG